MSNQSASCPPRRAFDECLFGLALSGGGIRSATFALSLLQGMVDRNILSISTSCRRYRAGGHIGSPLIYWIKWLASFSRNDLAGGNSGT